MKKWQFITAIFLLSGSAHAQSTLANIMGNILYSAKSLQATTPEARVPGAFVTMQNSIQNGKQTTTVSFDPRLQRKLVRNPLDPRHPTVANDVMTYALGQGVLYNNQPEPPSPPAPPAPNPPAPIVPLATSSSTTR